MAVFLQRRVSLMLLVTLLMVPLHAQTFGVDRAPVTLDSMRDRYRPLLVFAPHLTSEFRKQMSILADGAKDLRERDMLNVPIVYKWSEMGDGIFDGIGNVTVTLSLAEQAAARRRFHIRPNDFTVILIGKDGGEKLRSHQPISLDTVRSTIDAMPMRQEEMRSQPKP
jgi:hypothetical protein